MTPKRRGNPLELEETLGLDTEAVGGSYALVSDGDSDVDGGCGACE